MQLFFFFSSAVGQWRNRASCRKVTSVEQMLTNTEIHGGVSAALPDDCISSCFTKRKPKKAVSLKHSSLKVSQVFEKASNTQKRI